MVRILCTICLNYSSRVENFRVIPCGHAFCQNCISAHLVHAQGSGNGAFCPQCRQGPVTEEDVRPIFLEFADGPASSSQPAAAAARTTRNTDAEETQFRSVKEGLAKLGPTSMPSAAKAIAEKIGAFQGVNNIVVLNRIIGAVSAWFGIQGTNMYCKLLEVHSELDESASKLDTLVNKHNETLNKHAIETKTNQAIMTGLRNRHHKLETQLVAVKQREAAALTQVNKLRSISDKCDELSKQVIVLQERKDTMNDLLGEKVDQLKKTNLLCNKYKARVQSFEEMLEFLETNANALTDGVLIEGRKGNMVLYGERYDRERRQQPTSSSKHRNIASPPAGVLALTRGMCTKSKSHLATIPAGRPLRVDSNANSRRESSGGGFW